MSEQESREGTIRESDVDTANRRPSRKTTRIKFACLRCQKRKIKCDGNSPCLSCRRASAACLSGVKQNDKYCKAYVASLYARVRWLENMLRSNNPGIDLSGGPLIIQETDFHNGDHHSDIEGDEFSDTARSSVPASAGVIPPERLAHEIGLVSVTAGQDLRYIGPSSGYSFTKLLFASIGRRSATQRQSGVNRAPSALAGETFRVNPAPLPASLENAVQLSQAYWDNIHCQYPFLHQPTHRKLMSHVFSTDNPSPVAAFQVYMVLAVSTTILSRWLKLPLSAEGYCATAMSHFDKITIEGSLEGLQCLLLLQIYGMYNPSMGLNLWYLNYQCIACVLDLGLQRNVKASSNLSFLTQEMRTRTFWVVYSLDRTLATTMGRPIGLRDEACELRLPMDIDDEGLLIPLHHPRPGDSSPTSTTNAIHLFKLSQLNSEIKYIANSISHTTPAFTYPLIPDILTWQADVLDRLRQWAVEIPQLNETQTKHSEIKYHEMIMLLLRPSPAIHSPSHQSLCTCHESAISAIRTFEKLYRGDLLVFNWQTLHSIFLATVTMLYCTWTVPSVTRSTNVETLMKDLKTSSNVLSALAEHFLDASRGRDMLDELSSATLRWIMDSQKHGETAPDASIARSTEVSTETSGSRRRRATSTHGNDGQSTAFEVDVALFDNELPTQQSFDDFLSSGSWDTLFGISDESVFPIDTIMHGICNDFQPDFDFGQNLALDDILAGDPAQSLGTSMIMCFHFANQYGNSKAVLLMLLDGAPGLSPKGTFWFFSVVTLLGLGFVWFSLPETAGKSLEGMDEMFNLPWYTIGGNGAALTAGIGSIAEAMTIGDSEKLAEIGGAEQVEKSNEKRI
ncbi:hypothetical protein VTL71DRAFT_14480 [Oculimacula yallundae]|uniref:Zn(2)-C6 fungal-type domain-containing protein n=1 Tax=Oculimacula yallundae TaxID=86028 RepID=A0ABR4CJX9_9HELO